MPKLLRAVQEHYAAHKRDFPWRHTHDPYRVLVSEIMLQQTQAGRVVSFYKKFLKAFPTARVLARAPLSKVLMAWQGLGYNRRAKYLHEAAKIISFAKIPRSGEINGTPTPPQGIFAPEFWEGLPGVGHYTARAICAFAFNKPEVFIETNIRTVFIHHLLGRGEVTDKEIFPLVAEALKKSKMEPRDFYAALMDYGAYLKASGVRINNKSAHYTKQSKFEGSSRQLRGAIMRELIQSPMTTVQLVKAVSNIQLWQKNNINSNLAQLEKEQLIIKKGGRYSVAP